MAQQFFSPLQLNSTLTVGADDTGHDVIFYGATSGRSMLWDESYDGLILSDNTKLQLGSSTGSGDLQLLHNGTDSYIQNQIGQLYINQNVNDGDIVLQCDNGSGGLTAYLTLDGSSATNIFSKDVLLTDNISLKIGNAADMKLYHDGSHSYISDQGTGVLKILSSGVTFQNPAGSANALVLTEGGAATFTGNVTAPNLIASTAVYAGGAIYAGGNTLSLKKSDGNSYVDFDTNLNATFAGDIITGGDIINNTGNLSFTQNANDSSFRFNTDDGSGGVAEYFRIDGEYEVNRFLKNARFNDSVKANFGTVDDLQIYHDGSHSYIQANGTGDLIIVQDTNDKDIIFRSDDGSGGVAEYFKLNGGLSNSGYVYTSFPDNSVLTFGAAPDLQIYHDGSNSYIQDSGTGTLYVKTNSFRVRNSGGSEDIIKALEDGAVTLYYDNAAKLATASAGVEITGELQADSLDIDGNADISGDLGVAGAIYQTESGTTSGKGVFAPMVQGGLYATNTATVTGRLRIKVPAYKSSQMQTFYVDVYEYNTDRSATYRVSGYNYNDTNATWYNTSVVALFDSDNRDLTVRFGADTSASAQYVAIGEVNTTWTYPQVVIRDYASGYQASVSEATAAFTIEFVTTDNATYNVNHDNNQPMANWSKIESIPANVTNALPTTGGTMSGAIAMGNNNITGGGTITGTTLTGTSLDINGNADISGTTTLNNTTYFSSTGLITWGSFAGGTGFGIRGESGRALSLGSNGNFDHLVIDTSGNATFAGSVTIPEYIIHAGDTDTKFGFSGADTFLVHAGGGDKLKVETSGTVLLSDGGNADGSVLYLKHQNNNTTDTIGTIFFGNNADSTLSAIVTETNGANNTSNLKFRTSNAGTIGTALTLNADNSATFAGNVDIYTGAGDAEFNIGRNSNERLQIYQNDLNTILTADNDDDTNGTHNFILNRTFGGTGANNFVVQKDGTAQLTIDTNADATFAGDVIVGDDIFLADNGKILIGGGNDLQVYHDASNSYITNHTGNLYIQNNTNDSDIFFQSDDGSGGITTYFSLDGSATRTVFSKDALFSDNVNLAIGDSLDLFFVHTGTQSFITHQGTGNLYIRNTTDDKDIIFESDDGSGGVTEYLSLDGSDLNIKVRQHMVFNDSKAAYFGGGADLSILHDGSNSYIHHNTTGDLEIKADVGDIKIVNYTNDKDIIFKSDNGSGGTAEYFRVDGSLAEIIFSRGTRHMDNKKATFGSSQDLQIYHDGSNSYIDAISSSNLVIRNQTDDGDILFQSDNNSGGLETYMYLDGGNNNIKFQKDTNWIDNEKAIFGTGSDLKIYHDGTINVIEASLGDLYLVQHNNDKDILFQSDNGANSIATYFFLDGSAATHDGSATTALYTNWPDKSRISLGTSHDLQIYHNGTDSAIDNVSGGDLYISQKVADKDLIFRADDGSGGFETYFYLDGSLSGGNPRTIFPDNSRLGFGSSGDTYIEHDGSNGYIGNSTGHLYVRQNTDDGDIIFQSDDGSGGVATYFTVDGGAVRTNFAKELRMLDNVKFKAGTSGDLQIYHDGSDSYMSNMLGHIIIQNDAGSKDIIFKADSGSGVETYFQLDGSAGYMTASKAIRALDSVNLQLGASADFTMQHNGSNTVLQNFTGDLQITQGADDGDIIFQSDDASGGTTEYFRVDGGITKTVFVRDTKHLDTVKGLFGTNDDLQIYHDGSNSYIKEVGTGTLRLQTNGAGIDFYKDSTEFLARLITDGAVELYYDSVKKFETKANGVNTTYSIPGTTDGTHAGDIVHLGETTTVAGKIYYYKSDGAWALVDADAVGTCKGMLGVALGTSSSTNGMLLRGMITLDHDPGAVGDTLFVSTTAGQATATAPSGSGDIVRVIGYCLDASNGQIWFNPDGAFVEVA